MFNGSVVVSFPTVHDACLSSEGHAYFYDLQWRTNLLLGAWQGVPGFVDLVGDGKVKTFTNAVNADTLFYRVRMRLE